MAKFRILPAVAGMALAAGLTGMAQAEPMNIFAASQAQDAKLDTVRHGGRHYYRRHDGINPGLAAIGIIGGIAAGAAIANSADRYYYDDRYYDRPPPARYYYEDDDYCISNGNRPSHYPAPPGC